MDLELSRNQAERLARMALGNTAFRAGVDLLLDIEGNRHSSQPWWQAYGTPEGFADLFIAIGEALKKPKPQEQPETEPAPA